MDLSDCNVGRPEGGGLRSDPPHAPIKLLNGVREANIHSVVAIRARRVWGSSTIARARTSVGVRRKRGTRPRDQTRRSRSVTKGITSLLLGIEVERNRIRSMPMFNRFAGPAHPGERRHLTAAIY